MGIFDAITGMAERHPDVNEQQHSTLLQSAMAMFREARPPHALPKIFH
jgi:ribosomal 50S subunit-associated protein YjgA (DUF615 family)